MANEALKDSIAHQRASYDDIGRVAAVCRVAEATRPYLETLAHR